MPLCRIYFKFNKCWFKDIKKSITDSKIRFFIRMNYKTGLVMISYVDMNNAINMNKLYN